MNTASHRYLILRVLSLLIILIPVIVLDGWIINNEQLKSVFPVFTPMNPMSALCFIFLGVGVFLYTTAKKQLKFISWLCGGYVAIFGGLMLLKYVLNIDLHLDQLLFASKLGTNRMAPNTAFCFMVAGVLLIFIQAKNRYIKIILEAAILLIMFISGQAFVGYLLNLVSLYQIESSNPMAVHTAMTFIIFSIAMYIYRSDFWVSVFLISSFTGKSMGRKINISLMISLFILLVVSFISYINTERLINIDNQINQKYQEQSLRNRLIYDMINAETGQRGFILTGNESYLDPYNAGSADQDNAFSALFKIANDPQDPAIIKATETLIDAKLAELAQTIQLRKQSGVNAALEVINTNNGQNLMNQIRNNIQQMDTIDAKDQIVLNKQKDQIQEITIWTVAGGSVFAIFIVILAIYFINRDLKSRMKDQLKLEETKRNDEAILASIGEGLIATDEYSRIAVVNKAAEEIIGYSSQELISQNFSEIIKAQDEKGNNLTPENRAITEALMTGEKVARTLYYLRKNGTKFPAAVTVSPIVIDGKPIGAIEVFRDVTHEMDVDRMKTEFISLASHQLRTPLSAMKWFSEMLIDGDAGQLNTQQKEFINNINQSNERMIGLVNSLLNVSRIESGRISVDPEPTDLKVLIDQVLVDLKGKLEDKKQKIVVSMYENMPKFNIDPKLISQVYINLLTNAIKYTPAQGEISIFISKKDDQVISQISDTGYGIPKSEQEKVFQKFYRGSNIVKRETDGNGLGMYLVKSIIDSSGGKIWFESTEGKGTTFWFSLPLTGMVAKKGEVTLNA